MNYVLAYPEFAPHSAQKIDDFRAIHEPERARLVPPHVTLVFGLDQVKTSHILKLCEAITGNRFEFPVTFSNAKTLYDPYENAHKLCLSCDTGKEILATLHNQLYEGLEHPGTPTPSNFHPHMTVATHAEQSEVRRADIRDIGDLPITALVTTLEVVKVIDGRIRTQHSVRFLKRE